MVAFEVDEPAVGAALDGMRALGVRGMSVTMPGKEATARLVDELSPDAAALGAVNSVVLDGTRLVGHNTDGPGLVDALRLDLGVDPSGCRTVVLGAGGAARAVVRALGNAGAEVVVAGRSPERVAVAAALAGTAGRTADLATASEVLAGADVIVNATPVGMGDDVDGIPLDPEVLHEGQVVVDLIYHPLETRLLREAASRGARIANGVGMLVHQAGHQFRLWTGRDAPIDVMQRATRDALA
jgi:shikimate dehydrogenase